MGNQKVYEGSSSLRIAASRAELWRWLRSVDSALYWHPHCIDAQVPPGSEREVGEEWELVSQPTGGANVTTRYRVVTARPGEQLALRELTALESTVRIDLADATEGGTELRVTLATRSPKKSFRRWVNPVPGLTARAATIAGRVDEGFRSDPTRSRRP